MLNSYQFKIIAVTEAWLQDTDYQRDYVQVNGYNTVFKNRTGKRGCESNFNTRCVPILPGITRNYPDLEILEVEICGRNKKTLTLVCAVYQRAQLKLRNLNGLKSLSNF